MQILLSYSRAHFAPDVPADSQDHQGSSANLLARALYDVLSQCGQVTYVDPSEHADVKGRSFDLFVGQVTGFTKMLDSATITRSILFAVNMHPVERNERLAAFVKAAGLPYSSIVDFDLQNAGEITMALSMADHILCVGNMAVYNSYITHGVPRTKIKMLNYGVGTALRPVEAPPPANRFVHVASEIGLRKGFDIVDELARQLASSDPGFHLDVLGAPVSDLYRAKLAALVADHPGQITDHGWVDASDPRYEQILRASAFVLAPALEEGQAGAVLDCMRQGLVPLSTPETGIDFSPLGRLEGTPRSERNLAVVSAAARQSPAQIQRLRSKTLEYYTEYHQDFAPLLRAAIESALAGHLYPKVSVTLAIFNKERTILSLLRYLDRAMSCYGHVELHLIFDGCHDQTEPRVRQFFAQDRGYPVTFEVTPDIFEVRTNNIGLKKSTGDYCMIVQDDNYVYDKNLLFEVVGFLDKNPMAGVLGTLAGVNFYPRGTIGLEGPGQIAMSPHETYWRQDAVTDPSLADQIFQVDACMRGPLVMRRSALEEVGYLDEAYAPLYMDDMDLGFAVAARGYKVYALLGGVENNSLTMASYDQARNDFFGRVISTNTSLFYSRWTPGTDKDYLRIERTRIAGDGYDVPRYRDSFSLAYTLHRGRRGARHVLRRGRRVARWLISRGRG